MWNDPWETGSLASATSSDDEEDGDVNSSQSSSPLGNASAAALLETPTARIRKVLKEYVSASDARRSRGDGSADVDKLFGMFTRLHDDEAFDDWLSLGVPTNVDPVASEDGDVVDSTDQVRSLNRIMQDTLSAKGDEFDPSFITGTDVARELSKARSYEELKAQRTAKRQPASPRSGGSNSPRSTAVAGSSAAARAEVSPRRRIKRFSVVQQSRSIYEKRDEIEACIDSFEATLNAGAAPHSLSQFVDRCSAMLEKLDTGVGVTAEVVASAREALSTAADMSGPSFNCDLLLTYVVHFLNSQIARDARDAEVR
ncbi:MAG: hypothetical protein Q8J97_16865, partial [Flavobacteriaceae bacterium]|nr:hypothetical protein [Flavobacteriaceae bacterium]